MTSTTETCESSETAAKLKYCSVSPKKELNFVRMKNMYTSKLVIANPSPKKPILFRIRINASEQYSVSPSTGFILPKGSRAVQITFRSKTEIEERCKDMFLIQVLQCSGDDYVEEPKEVLNEFTKLLVQGLETQNLKLKVHFEICSELTLKSKTNVSSNSQIPATQAKKATFFNKDMGSPARIHGLRSSTPMVNNICPYKKSRFETNSWEKPLASPPKLCNSNFRQNIVNRFSFPEGKGSGSPVNIDYIVETKMTESSPTKSYQSSSSGPKVSDGHHQRTDSKSIYQKKFESLEKRFKQQEDCLTKILQEKSDFLHEINKFKFTFTSETISTAESAEVIKNPTTKEGPRYELWQLMTISIIFLIAGSLLRDFRA